MRGKQLIGLVGSQGSGKNTVADILKDLWPQRVMDTKKASFAYFLKKSLSSIFGVDERLLFEGTSEQKNNTNIVFGKINMPLRILMQKFGTECLRSFCETIHIDMFVDRVINSDASIIAIPDVRFEDEAAFIRKNKGILVKIDRNTQGLNEAHQSEQYVHKLDTDLTITNNGTMEDLSQKVLQLICPKVDKNIFKKNVPDHTAINVLTFQKYQETGVWEDVPMSNDSFYIDVPNTFLFPIIGVTT